MSAKFFQSIRRNQKQWMVVVTVLSMVSFLFLDDFGRGKGPMSAFGGALMIGCLCAAAMCIIGYGRQKTAEFGIGGFLAGFILGFIGFGVMAQNKPVARTSIGNLTRQDFEQMAQQRQRVNQFLSSLSRRIPGVPAGFGGIDDESLVSHRLLLADAKKMGIRISDEGVNEFLKQVTNNRLTKQDFKESLREARLGEGELFNIVKDELSVLLTQQLIDPPAVVVQVRPEWAQFSPIREPLRYMQQTPLQLWDSFQMLNLKQSLQAVAIPVNEFVGDVSEPSDAELAEFFSKYRNVPWRDEAVPGFLQLPRVKLAYFTADFETFEKGLDPTDDDIREYYEKNKDRYRAPAAKESTAPKLPDGVANSPDESKEEALTPEAPATPEAQDTNASPTKDTEDKAPSKNDPKPEPKPEQKEEPPKENDSKNKQDPEPKSESNCGEEGTATEKESEEKPAAEAKPEESTPSETTTEPKAETAEEKKPDAESPIEVPPSPQPNPAFRELNDDLKAEIREAILRERAFAKMSAALDRAYDTMIPLGLEYDTSTDAEQKKQKAKSISDKLKEYAVLQQLEYVETPEWDYASISVEPIGMAVDTQGRSIVANDVLMRGERGESRMPLYSPRRADLRNKRGGFAYWKIEDTPARVPELQEADVREKVIRAWKFDQARRLAEKRAKALADKAKAEEANLTAAVSGESATGQKTDTALSVIETPEFTWLSTPQSVPGAQQDPMATDIPLIPNAGNDFMKTVFEDLNEGEIGVAANANRSVYYVVKVTGRESTKDDGGVAQQERNKQFLSQKLTGMYPIFKSPYESIAQFPQRAIDQAWRQNIAKRFSVEWDEDVQLQRRRR